jgi:superfamily II DNA or RNA helicase
MKPPITQKMLVDWAGPEVLREAESLVSRGLVLEAAYDPPLIKGAVLWNNRSFKTSLKLLSNGMVESQCPCWTNVERGLICSHVIALALTLVKRATDPHRETKYQEEIRRASRLAAIKEEEYVKRLPPETPGAIPARLSITLGKDWMEECRRNLVSLTCEIEYQGKTMAIGETSRDIPFSFGKQDESILFVLEDISEGPARSSLAVTRADFLNVVNLHAGRSLMCRDGRPITVNSTKLTTFFKMDFNGQTGELILTAHTELPFLTSGSSPFYIVAGRNGWVYGADNLWSLQNVLPDPYHPLYEGSVTVARPDMIRFFQNELPAIAKHARVESDIALDLFTIEPATPRFRLRIQGSPASLAAILYALYDDVEIIACKPDPKGHFSIPDPNDLMRYTVRNPESEKKALALLNRTGLTGEAGDSLSHIVGSREVLNFLGTHIPMLRRQGWQIDMEGKIAPYLDSLDSVTPVVHVTESPGHNWFDIAFDFEDGKGQSLSSADIQIAIQKGEFFVKSGNRTLLIDSEAINSMRDIFSDCATEANREPGHFCMPNVYAPFVKASLDALDGVDVEDCPAWRMRAGQSNRTARIEPVPLEQPLDGILRPYQQDGVNWLRFLEAQGFAGLLADEMGLGKTLQTLAWLNLSRTDDQCRGKPALIVCPTSIVENWAEEAARFVPRMKVLTLSGPDRHDKWGDIAKIDIVVTSYALLRRDLDRYLEKEFSVMILDEAQHIKNRSTQNALAAKQIQAHHRLVLTGTPMENSVSDLWSIMDFLMPGYLGSHDSFRQNYELPIAREGIEADAAQTKLRRKLHPFLLRRLKTDVAKDLPPKIQRIAHCELTKDQKLVYNEFLESSRRRIGDMVAQRGFNKCRMEVLTVLMRLRQICCHLGLLDLPGLTPQYPSAKMDLFFELLDEAFDSGHRVLVFSQFVSMLTLLRGELESRGLTYCYLDGATKDRLKIVHQFNSTRSIPLFLISLKAGGTGLNLTGADMVIHFDPWWNPAVEDQATDRAYRIGQKRTVYSVKLITKGTVEEKVLALQKKKKDIIAATIESDEGVMQAMTWEDIQDILDL